MILYHGTTSMFDHFDHAWGVKTKGQNYVSPNLMGRLLMELRDGKMEYKLPEDWNNMLTKISRNE